MLEHIGIGIKRMLLETGQKRIDQQRAERDNLLKSGVPNNSDRIVRINEEIAAIREKMDELENENA